jgi:hypothetical protein
MRAFSTSENIFYGTVAVVAIIFLCLLPAGVLLLFDYFTNYKYHWYAFGTMFVLVTCVSLFSKQIANKIYLFKNIGDNNE